MGYRRRKFAAVVPMSSMADIAFLLLIFFMVSSVLKVETEIPIKLPEAAGKQIKDGKDQRVTIQKNGKYWLGNHTYQLPEILARLQVKAAGDPSLLVLIQADGDLGFEVVEKFFEKLKGVGVENIGLVTKQDKSKL